MHIESCSQQGALSFTACIPFISFCTRTPTLSRPSNTVFNRIGVCECLCLNPHLRTLLFFSVYCNNADLPKRGFNMAICVASISSDSRLLYDGLIAFSKLVFFFLLASIEISAN